MLLTQNINKKIFYYKINNYYKYFSFYDCFGILEDPFFIDVHTVNNKKYLDLLQKVANNIQKEVYASYDDGAMIYNRTNGKLELFENIEKNINYCYVKI